MAALLTRVLFVNAKCGYILKQTIARTVKIEVGNTRHRCTSSWKIQAWYFESLILSRYTIYDMRTTIYGFFDMQPLNIQLCEVYDVFIQQQFFVLMRNW